jgi:hypothetical protein
MKGNNVVQWNRRLGLDVNREPQDAGGQRPTPEGIGFLRAVIMTQEEVTS